MSIATEKVDSIKSNSLMIDTLEGIMGGNKTTLHVDIGKAIIKLTENFLTNIKELGGILGDKYCEWSLEKGKLGITLSLGAGLRYNNRVRE